MRRKLFALNVVLLVAAATLMYYLRTRWREAQVREQMVLLKKIEAAPAPPLVPEPKQQPVKAATYAEVAQKMLFSKDRNPTVIYDPPPPPPPPKPMPALPASRGLMLFGDVPPTIILVEKGSNVQKGYRPGETIGPFKIVSFDNKEITFEWEGKQVKRRLDELVEKDALPPAAPPTASASAPRGTSSGAAPVSAAAAPDAAQQPATQSLSSAGKNGPGVAMSSDMRACQTGDASPSGTVVDGYRKVIGGGLFGNTCRWEQVK